MNMTTEGSRPSNVQATIEQIRYWVPTIKDVAEVIEARDEESWLLSIEPKVAAACPVAIALKDAIGLTVAVRPVAADALPRFEMKARRFVIADS